MEEELKNNLISEAAFHDNSQDEALGNFKNLDNNDQSLHYRNKPSTESEINNLESGRLLKGVDPKSDQTVLPEGSIRQGLKSPELCEDPDESLNWGKKSSHHTKTIEEVGISDENINQGN
jgi:hypothetical protein